MASNEPVQRVRIYLNERDLAAGQPTYLAALERLRREGATGATALRGIAGFGAGHRIRISGADALTTSPVVIEWVDRAERVAAHLSPTRREAHLRTFDEPARRLELFGEWLEREGRSFLREEAGGGP